MRIRIDGCYIKGNNHRSGQVQATLRRYQGPPCDTNMTIYGWRICMLSVNADWNRDKVDISP